MHNCTISTGILILIGLALATYPVLLLRSPKAKRRLATWLLASAYAQEQERIFLSKRLAELRVEHGITEGR